MKPLVYIVIAIVVTAGIGTFVYFFLLKGKLGPSCPVCSPPGEWSRCDESYKKTRNNYKCSEETGFKCESYIEESICETSISLHGNVGLDITISPTKDKYVKGNVTVSINAIPIDSGRLMVMLSPKGVELTDNPYLTPGVIVQYLEPVSGQNVTINTKRVDDGEYNIVVAVANPNQDSAEKTPWVDFVQTELVVENTIQDLK